MTSLGTRATVWLLTNDWEIVMAEGKCWMIGALIPIPCVDLHCTL